MAENPLVGLSFQVTAIVEHGQNVPIVEGTAPAITFRETSFYAETGCNRLRGAYEVDRGGHFVGSEIIQTMMKCDQPRTDQQHRILGVLAGQPSIELASGSLTFSTDTSALHGQATRAEHDSSDDYI